MSTRHKKDHKGITLLKRERYREAEEATSKAVTMDKKYPPFFNNFGDVLLKREKYHQAGEAYRKALENNQKGSNSEEKFRAHFGLAKVHALLAERGKEDWMCRESLKYLDHIGISFLS
ncbi:tetratricopeptide repeat protein [Candidatus Scalindua japonica]|uniref:tetratricopeptide repeat protein n=1 Tax=Candidatus Scalindua japonica TaxID=1284222 RepID=UPI0013A5314B|nr:tetratricopeptide repeat protein [Candidatus Scalindua japonica]